MILYREPQSSSDIRFPRRKVFGMLSNREGLLGTLPAPKIRMKSLRHEHFSACGESTAHATTYTDVGVRHLRQIPRLSLEDKEAITGVSAPGYGEAGSQGHP